MKTIIALAIIAAFGTAAAPALAVDTSISKLCGPDAPEGYKRPGGYCEQIAGNESENTGSSERPWWYDYMLT